MKNFVSQSIVKFSILFAVILFSLPSAYAAGVFDPTFGTNGRVTTSVCCAAQAKAVAIQPDGKIIVVGDAFRQGTEGVYRDTVLVRYNPNGALDASFGEGGRVFAAISPTSEGANAVALQPDGKIIVAGYFYSSITASADFLVARFNPDGGLDTNFGDNGKASINRGSVDILNAVVVQPDGKIVGVGETSDGDRAAVVRFNSNGSVDATFGDDGAVYFELQGFSQERFTKVALLPDGRILVGGNGSVTVPHSGFPGFLVSFNLDGSLSANFGTNGIVIVSDGFITPGFDFEVLPDGKILAVADRTYRFFSNGTRDTSFTGNVAGSGLAVRSDGRFIVSGSFYSNFQTGLFTSDGRLIGGAKNLSANEIAVQSDDKLIFINSTEFEFVVTRLITITSQATRLADYDNDDKTDIAVLRPSNSALYVLRSRDGFIGYNSGEASFEVRRVIPEYKNPLPFVYWRSNGNIIGSPAVFCGTNGTAGNRECVQWGMLGDIPVGGDYDGDRFTDDTVYRPSNGVWYIRQSSGRNLFTAVQWGTVGDKPVPADYDYDGITDTAIYRPSTGTWWVLRSSDGTHFGFQFGIASDIPLTGDYDGDGRADFVVYRPSSGIWYQFLTTVGFRAIQFGISTDIPVPGDYDGDGRHDVAVFREGIWYLLQSSKGFAAVQWGLSSDVPVSVRYDE